LFFTVSVIFKESTDSVTYHQEQIMIHKAAAMPTSIVFSSALLTIIPEKNVLKMLT
jgi:hypothetical protein